MSSSTLPVYDGFRKAITGLGRELRGVPVGDEEALERELARPDAKVLVLCSPHNPTGRVWTADELARTAALAERYGVAVISDEIHADFVHDDGAGRVHVPWTRVAGEGRWALITSGSKAFNFPALTGSYGFIGDPADRTEFLRRMETAEGLASPAVLSLTAHIAAYREGRRGWTRCGVRGGEPGSRGRAAGGRLPRAGGCRRGPDTWRGSTCGRWGWRSPRCSGCWWSGSGWRSWGVLSTARRGSCG